MNVTLVVTRGCRTKGVEYFKRVGLDRKLITIAGLFWVKVKEPKHDTEALRKISSTALPLILVVITMTGYAAVILWLLVSTHAHAAAIRSAH